MFKQPPFWHQSCSLWSCVLWPLGQIYGLIIAARFLLTKPFVAPIPVICVGNLSVGGAGKTPVCLALAQMLKNHRPYFLTRGYLGSLSEPTLVNLKKHQAGEVGDEALLLAKAAPTIMSKDRVAGAKLAFELGAGLIIMDDGFQNPSLQKDVSLLVFDDYSLGNGCIFPAGPLRESLRQGMKRADGIILLGSKKVQTFLPIFMAQAQVLGLKEKEKLMAFCGIGQPLKFFNALRKAGHELVLTQSFPDHYVYSENDLKSLWEAAQKVKAKVVTTSKDWVKLPEKWQKKIQVVDIHLAFKNQNSLVKFITEKL